jgi:prevent-host-death family protein
LIDLVIQALVENLEQIRWFWPPVATRLIPQSYVALIATQCYDWSMSREISVRELRNHTAEVVAAVRSGERLSLTVNRTPVADIVPHAATRSPWVPSSTLRALVATAGADAALLEDLADVRNTFVDDE